MPRDMHLVTCNSPSGKVVNRVESSVFLTQAIPQILRLGLTSDVRKVPSRLTMFVVSGYAVHVANC
jgi:hypothetical protein